MFLCRGNATVLMNQNLNMAFKLRTGAAMAEFI